MQDIFTALLLSVAQGMLSHMRSSRIESPMVGTWWPQAYPAVGAAVSCIFHTPGMRRYEVWV